jgi:hypothetical protein
VARAPGYTRPEESPRFRLVFSGPAAPPTHTRAPFLRPPRFAAFFTPSDLGRAPHTRCLSLSLYLASRLRASRPTPSLGVSLRGKKRAEREWKSGLPRISRPCLVRPPLPSRPTSGAEHRARLHPNNQSKQTHRTPRRVRALGPGPSDFTRASSRRRAKANFARTPTRTLANPRFSPTPQHPPKTIPPPRAPR